MNPREPQFLSVTFPLRQRCTRCQVQLCFHCPGWKWRISRFGFRNMLAFKTVTMFLHRKGSFVLPLRTWTNMPVSNNIIINGRMLPCVLYIGMAVKQYVQQGAVQSLLLLLSPSRSETSDYLDVPGVPKTSAISKLSSSCITRTTDRIVRATLWFPVVLLHLVSICNLKMCRNKDKMEAECEQTVVSINIFNKW